MSTGLTIWIVIAAAFDIWVIWWLGKIIDEDWMRPAREPIPEPHIYHERDGWVPLRKAERRYKIRRFFSPEVGERFSIVGPDGTEVWASVRDMKQEPIDD